MTKAVSVSYELQLARMAGFGSVAERQQFDNKAANDRYLTALGYTVTPTGITVTPKTLAPEKPAPTVTPVETSTKTTTQVETAAASTKPVSGLSVSSSSLQAQAQKIFGSNSTMLIMIAAVLIFVGVVLK